MTRRGLEQAEQQIAGNNAPTAGIGAPASSSQRAGAHVDVPEERAWLTTEEAAALGLVGCPSGRSLRMAITAGEIPTRKRRAVGGGREFHWTQLPREARAEYLTRYGVADAGTTLATVSPAARETEKDLRAETRKKIVDAAALYVARSKRTKGAALDNFAELYASQRLRGFEAIDHQLEPTATPDQVRAWDRTIRTKGAGALIDGRGRPTGTGFFDRPENITMRNYVIAGVAANGKITAGLLCGDLERDLGRTVPVRTMQAFLAKVRCANPGLLKALHNPDKHRSHHRPAFGTRDVFGINERWELDATRADAMCRLPDGSERRANLTALIDVGTRRAMVLVSDQPRAVATQALLRRAVMVWGVPAILKTDNGKEFSNRDVVRFCDATGIKIEFSQPFHPEQKPHIERFFGTLNKGFFPSLQGYVGANIAERKAIESRNSFAHRFGEDARLVFGVALSPSGLQARIDTWCRDDYEQRPHGSLKGRGETPANVALLQADLVKRLTDERALDQLLLPLSGTRVVLKKGISVGSRWFIAPELGAVMGQRVLVRHDPHDPARITVYRDTGNDFLCIAVDPDLSGDSRMRIAIGAQQLQGKTIRATREAVRNVHRLYPPGSAADRRLAHLAGDGFVLAPDAEKAMAAAESPALIAAARAADAAESQSKPEQPIEPTAEEHAAYLAEVAPPATPAHRMEQCDGYERPVFIDDDIGFYDWALAHIAAGQALDAQDIRIFDQLKNDKPFQAIREQRGVA